MNKKQMILKAKGESSKFIEAMIFLHRVHEITRILMMRLRSM